MNDKQAIEERYISLLISTKEQINKINSWNYYHPNEQIHFKDLEDLANLRMNSTKQSTLEL